MAARLADRLVDSIAVNQRVSFVWDEDGKTYHGTVQRLSKRRADVLVDPCDEYDAHYHSVERNALVQEDGE